MDPTGPKLAGVPRQYRLAPERRHTVRHRAHSPAYATLDESAGSRDLSEILDISEEGMSIQTASPLEVERSLSLCLDLSETRTRIRTTGQVVWSDTSGRAGIRFARLSPQALGELKEWLFVNVLTAFDHADATQRAEDGGNGASNRQVLSHTMPKDELALGFLRVSGDSESHWKLDAVPMERVGAKERDTEVELNGIDRETTLQLIAERALALTRATGAALALSDSNDREMTCVASAGSDAPPVGVRLQVGSGFSGECVRTGRSLRCDDSEIDDRVDRDGCQALGIRSIVAVPIRSGTKVAGLLEVFSSQPYAFSAGDIGALQQLAGSVLSSTKASRTAEEHVPFKTPAASPPPARPARVEKPALPEVEPVIAARPVIAAKPSTQPSLHKILLVAAIGTFVFAVLWLIAPWVSSTLRSSDRTKVPAQVPQQAAPPKAVSLPANVTDLATVRKVAEQGDPAAQFALGAHYATGDEVVQDYTEAMRWFTLAAEQGHILAQATLGAYYWAGRGVPQDLTKAYYWSFLAQAGGDQASKYRVAVLTSRMSRGQVLAAQQQANDWLRNFASHTPTTR